ncbi:hypothetical protein Glove_52g119 [Diversispora epigaea]|uniref:C2H2-type domain-containing protein n=1 Tax=Diversispora epigaea TaxID=1348612 RepID=A0A397JHP8_9GLOM|nr:hypothetical protein Glove_52g119 [Diversispora epigaea]
MPKDFKCLYCDHYFSSRQAYAQHVNRTHYDINDTSLDDKDFNRINQFEEMQTYKDQNMPLASHEYEDVLENTDFVNNFSKNYDINQTSQKSNMEDYDSFEQVSPDRFEESNIEDYDNFEQVSPEREENVMEFPNEAYADLMELFIKHNLNNKTENAIIKFFDKHSNLSTSPLPKNIEASRKLIDIMNVQKLPYSKHCILDYKNKEYFIYYHPIKSCIESLLSNPDIIKNFIYKYQFLQSNMEDYYSFEQVSPDRFEESNIEDYDNFEQVSPEREENVMEFPNEAYADLMELFIKHNLNNKTGNAIIKFFDKHSNLSTSPLPKNIEASRKLIDIMNVQKLPYSKHCILDYKNKEYFIYYHPIKSCIESLLSNPDIIKNFIYKYQFLQSDGETLYNATTTDSLGKSSLHSIYISLGNIRTWRRNKEDDKQLLGYLPILSANNEGQTSRFKRLECETFHNSLKFLLDPLFDEDGIDFKINNKNIWFFSRISTVIGNWPEAYTFSLTFKSANSNYLCHFCQTYRNDLTSIRKDCIIIHNKENMQEYYNNSSAESIGLEQVYNYFWTIPNIDIYAATVPDRMHHLDLGLFRYQIEYTKELLGKLLEDKMN